ERGDLLERGIMTYADLRLPTPIWRCSRSAAFLPSSLRPPCCVGSPPTKAPKLSATTRMATIAALRFSMCGRRGRHPRIQTPARRFFERASGPTSIDPTQVVPGEIRDSVLSPKGTEAVFFALRERSLGDLLVTPLPCLIRSTTQTPMRQLNALAGSLRA